jgi:T5SS/PEP-CTERM-associated repeat protein
VSGSGSVFVTNAFNMGTNPGGSENSALITGAGSRLDVGNVIYVGNKGSSNTLAIADSALVKLDGYDIRFDWVAPATNNYLRLQAGYFAWAGSRAGSIASKEGYIQLWDDAAAEYKTLSDLTPEERTALNYSVTYYADDASAEVATGYSGLGGYTVVTGGILPAVEPPAVKPGLVILVK